LHYRAQIADYRQVLVPGEQAVQNFGRALFDALFTGEVHRRYAVSQVEAADSSIKISGISLPEKLFPAAVA
jgi:hypothetical protein